MKGTIRRDGRVRSISAALAAYAVAVLPTVVIGFGGAGIASATDGTVGLTDLTAPNIIGDSNVNARPDEGPDAFMIATEYCNTNAHPIYDVTTNVGTWGGSPATSTAGEFEDTVVPVGLYSYDGTFDLDMVPGTGNPETRYLGELDPGECVIINTIVSYDVVDADGDPVWGASNSIDDDLVYAFDYWATWLDPGADGIIGTADDPAALAVSDTETVTVRNEITAAANKIETSTVIVEPDTTVAVGEIVSITFDGVDFGLVNQGFDADGDGNPDYDIWFQAIGEAGLWDPDVFQLVGISASIVGSGCGGGRPDVTITAIDTTYFTGLDAYGNCGWSGSYTYTFVAISVGSSTVAPYQETASGSDNEKYNNDYCGDDPASSPEYCPTLTSTGTDLILSKSVAPEKASPGDTLTWSINLVNPEVSSVGDPDSGFGVVIEDAIPAQTTFVAGSAACGMLACQIVYSADGGTSYATIEPAAASVTNIRWLIDETVIGGTDDTVSFQTAVDLGATGFISNLAGLTIGGQAPNFAAATSVVCIVGCSELAIDKDATTPTAIAGGTATYTILVENDAAASAPATGVEISDTLPIGFTYASTGSIVLAGTATRPTVLDPTPGDAVPTWGAFELAPGDSVLVTFTVDIDAGVVAGTYDNTAQATSGETVVDQGTVADDGGFPVGTDPEGDDDVTIAGPALTVDKDTSTPLSVAGGQATYEIEVANIGSSAATDVTIRDNFPSIWTYASSTVTESSATRTVVADPAVGDSIAIWGNWTIDPGGSVTIVVVVDIPATALDGTYDNSTVVSAANHLTIDDNGVLAQDADTPPGADPETDEDVTLRSADVSIVKSDQVDPVPIGQAIVYELLVTSNGPLDATGVVVTDTIAATSSFISASSTIGTCSESGGLITCDLGDMPSGAAATITVTVNDTNATVVNTAAVTTTSHDGNPTNDSDIEFTTITTDPVVKASDGGGTVVEGQTINYTITINNTSGGDWTGIAVSDPLPAGTSEVAGSTSITKAVESTAIDSFDTGDFSGGTGWNEAAWVTAGGAAVVANAAVLFDDDDEAKRSVDLSNATSATLGLDYVSSGYDGGESVTIEVSPDGTNWTVVQDVSTDASGSIGFDLTPYRSATTYVRVVANDLGGGGSGSDDQFTFDNVVVTYTELTAGVPGGDPADLILASDGYDLADGEYLTITYQVLVDDPIDPAITEITNTATLTATGLAGTPTGSVTDLVFPRAKIGDLVWLDTDGDGVKDATESGIDGVTVNLYLDDGDGVFEPGTDDALADTQITAGGGAYDFAGVDPGTYWVDVDDATLGVGTVSTTSNDPLLVAVAAGDDYDDADFGYRVVTDLSITKVDSADPVADSDSISYTLDITNNGPADASNVVVVDTLPAGVTFDSVGSSGSCVEGPTDTITCTIGALADGSTTSLTIAVDVDAGTDGTITNTATVTANEGEATPADNTATEDTVVYIPATISDLVWYDVDGDGGEDGGEPGLAGVTVRLYDAAGTVLLDTQVTDADGNYSFGGLAPGTYTVVVDDTTLPGGMTETFDADGTATPDAAVVTVVSDQDNATTDFGYTGTGAIGDFVFVDADGDGVLDAGETTGIAGAEIELTWAGVDGVLGNTDDYVFTTQTTLADGAYDFTNLPAGLYEVDVITEPAGYVLSTGNDPLTVTLAAAEDDNDADFGYYQTVTIGDEVWVDLDGDGINDAGEPAYEGMDVTLIDLGADGALGGGDDTTVGTVTTGATGAYSFSGVAPGVYAVLFDTADGALTLQDQGADEALDSDADATTGVALVTVVSGIGNSDIDAGVLPAVIGDTVWVDLDANGAYNNGEPGLLGTTVNLYDDANLDGIPDGAAVDTTTTDADGNYSFTVLPGSYVVEVVSAGSTFTTQDAVADDALDSDVDGAGLTDTITVVSGQTDDTIDGGVLPSVIGDLVWEDLDGDGVYDSGSESGFDGVTVNLIDAADGTTVLQTTTTAGGGSYSFTVAPGDYIIEVVSPAGYVPTLQDAAAATEATDSDVGLSGQTATITVSGTTTDNDVDAGLIESVTIGDTVFEDLDGDGLEGAGEDGLTGIDVQLIGAGPDGFLGTADDVVLDTETTDPSGTYLFTDVAPGTYLVTIDPATVPAGYTGTTADPRMVAVGSGDSVTTADFGYVPPAGLLVVKDPASQNVVSGDDATFTVTVTNTGGTELTNIAIDDPLASCDTTLIATLASGAFVAITCTTTAVTADFTNTVDVTADSPTGALSASDTADVVILTSSIAVVKDPATQDVVDGGEATFTVTVTNDGQTELTNIVIDDPLATCDRTLIASLAVGASVAASCTTTGVTADFTNTVDVTADDPIGTVVSATDSADVAVLTPALTVTKDPATQDVPLNDDATFTVTIENTGETVLVDIVIDDPLATCDTTSVGSLAVGASAIATCTTSGVTADFTNTVTVTADDPIGNVITDSDSADVTVLVPGVSITKDPATQFVVVGDTATFDITVANTGSLDLADATVSDPLAPACDRTFGLIVVGGSETYTCSQAPVVADYVNVASVAATDTAGNVVTASDTATVDVIDPSIDIQKTPDVIAVRAGDTVTFTIEVTNTGDATLTNVVVSDPLTATCDATFASLAPGATQTYTCDFTATADFTNTATVTADEPAGGTVAATDTADVDVVAPAIGVTKSPATQEVIVNGTATFGISVSNLGDSALSDVVVSDPLAPNCDATFASLAVGETQTYLCALSPVTTGLTNTVDVSADDLSGQLVTASDNADVTVVAGALDIQKTPNLQVIVDGGTATFDITVTNGGSIDLLNVAVADPSAPDCDNVIGTVTAGSSVSYTCTLSPVPADFTNTANVTAEDAVGNVLTDSDIADVDVIVPGVAVSKTPDLQTVVTGGDATFTISVTNTGDSDLSDVSVTDVAVPACATTIAALPVATTASHTCTRSGVTADFTNTVVVVADEPSGGTVTSSDTADVHVLKPSIEIQKSPDYQITGLGGDADFTITVTNSGATDLTDVVVSDPLVPSCDNTIATLTVGVTVSYTCTGTLVAGDFTNTANVTADDPLGNPVTDSDTADVDLVDPGLAVSKTPDLQTLLSGDTANFTIEVTNTGDIDLADVDIADPNAPNCNASFPTLAVGVTETVLCALDPVTADFVNTATVTAPNPLGGNIVVSDTATVDVVSPGISIEKTPDNQQVVVGTDATFTITVTNSGTENLVGVAVSDPSASVCNNTIGALAVGASVSYDCTVTGVTDDFTNIALVDGVDVLANPVSDSDDAAVDAISPSIAISKIPNMQTVVTGGTATFTIEVTNTGDVPLVDVTVVDVPASDCDIDIAVLAPGETVTYTCTQPNVTSDFTDIADVSATDPLGGVVTASDSNGVVVLVPAIEIQKTPDLQQVTAGDTATFTITVINGGQTALTDVVVSDPQVPSCGRIISSLAIGASTSYTCAAVVSIDFTNTASVTADDPLGNPWTDSDTADVDTIAPSLYITKSPDVQSVPLGSLATFTIEVTNDGDADLTAITVTDPSTPACDNTLPFLAAGTTWSYTCDAIVNADFTNSVFVTGLDPNLDVVDGGSDLADVTALLPGVLVEKSPDAQAIGVGQDATFTITVTNIGDVDLATIDVVDATFPICDNAVGPLGRGDSTSYTCTVTDVLAGFTNTVEATATDGNGNVAMSTDDADVMVLPASISITKVADSIAVIEGGDITYTITVANDGPADLANVTVTDVMLPACDRTFATLLAGGVEVYTCTLIAVDAATADPVVNTIAVLADDAAGNPITDTATATVDVLVPALSVFKNALTPTVVEGDDATFEITIINTGDVPLTDVTVTDTAYPVCDRFYAALAVGEIQSYTCTITSLIDDVTNIVDATGTDPIDGPVTDRASATVTVVLTGDLTGFVFADEDGDGVYEAADGDAPIANVDVVVTDDSGNSTVLTTDVNGVYTATLPIGDYTVEVDVTDPDFPAGHPVETTGTDGQTVTVADDTPVNALDVGFGPPLVGSVSGIVWHDIDADGVIDPDESEIPGAAVSARCAGPDGVLGTADDSLHGPVVTASSYTFVDLPTGACVITIDSSTLPEALRTPTYDLDGGLDSETIVVVTADDTVSAVDFGHVNLVPVAVADSAVTDEGIPVPISVLTNDSDPEGHGLTVASVVQPLNGIVVINDDGSVTYTPAPGFDGVDTFTYVICDVGDECSTAMVEVTVRDTNTPPNVLTLTFDTVLGQPLTALPLDDLEGNGPYIATQVGGNLPTGVTLNADGSFTGIPATGGSFTFDVRVCDRLGACATNQITLTVTADRQVPATGSSSARLAQWALLLLAAGTALRTLGRRRYRTI